MVLPVFLSIPFPSTHATPSRLAGNAPAQMSLRYVGKASNHKATVFSFGPPQILSSFSLVMFVPSVRRFKKVSSLVRMIMSV